MVCISSLGRLSSIVSRWDARLDVLLDDFVCSDQGLERLNFIRQYWLNTQTRSRTRWRCGNPRCRRYILQKRTRSPGFVCEHHGTHFLTCFCFGADSSALVLLNVDYQLSLRLVLVDWPGRIMDFIVLVRIRSWASSSEGHLKKKTDVNGGSWKVRGRLHRFSWDGGSHKLRCYRFWSPQFQSLGLCWFWLTRIGLVIVGIPHLILPPLMFSTPCSVDKAEIQVTRQRRKGREKRG